MFDFMRERATAEDKRQETLNAYLDNALAPNERVLLEQQLGRDPQMRAELEQLRALRLQLRSMPHRRVPRSFALDPARYGRPRAQPLFQMQPILRGASVLTAFLLIFTLALGAFQGQFAGGGVDAPAAAPVASTALEQAASAETADDAASMAAGAEEAREAEPMLETEALPAVTDAPAEESAGVMAVPAEGAPAAEGTTAPVPESDLSIELDAAATATPEVSLLLETTAPAPTIAAVVEAMATAAPEPATQTAAEGYASLLPLQIGLGVALVLFVGLWLLSRRGTTGL